MTTNPYTADRDITERLVRMETKLDAALQRSEEDRQKHHTDVAAVRAEHDRDVTKIREDAEAIEDKVGKLENWKYAATAALLMSGGSGVATVLNLAAK